MYDAVDLVRGAVIGRGHHKIIPKRMAARATKLSTFPLFSSFPRELRDQIWHDALPDNVGPALYHYRKGCWCPRHLSRFDEGYDPENDENNLKFEFRHDLLDDIHFQIPLVFVNHEARLIALAWVREQGIEVRPSEDGQDLVSVRPFDLKRDALYIAFEKWDDFLREPAERQAQPDLFEHLVDIKTGVTRIAVPEALLRDEAASLPELFGYFFNTQTLLIVVNPQSDLQSTDNEVRLRRRWEFESIQGGGFFWDYDRGGFDSEDSEYVGDEALYRLITEAMRGLGEGLTKNFIRNFEIRLAFAVRR